MTYTLRFNTRAQFLAACDLIYIGADEAACTNWGIDKRHTIRRVFRQTVAQQCRVRRTTALEVKRFSGSWPKKRK